MDLKSCWHSIKSKRLLIFSPSTGKFYVKVFKCHVMICLNLSEKIYSCKPFSMSEFGGVAVTSTPAENKIFEGPCKKICNMDYYHIDSKFVHTPLQILKEVAKTCSREKHCFPKKCRIMGIWWYRSLCSTLKKENVKNHFGTWLNWLFLNKSEFYCLDHIPHSETQLRTSKV